MNKLKKLLAMLMSLIFIAGVVTATGVPVIADEDDVLVSGDYEYYIYTSDIDDDGKEENCIQIEQYTGSDANVEIPSAISGIPVTKINFQAFNDNKQIKTVTLPDSIIDVSAYSFFGCSSLTAINVSSKNENYVSLDGVLYEKDYDTDTGKYLPVTIECYPAGKTATSYTVTDSVHYIGGYAFYNCTALTSIKLPNELYFVFTNAFENCTSLESIEINGISDGELFILLGSEIGGEAFKNCTSLKSVVIRNISAISYNAFVNCVNLKEVTIPACVTDISENAFGYKDVEGESEYKLIDGFTIKGYKGSAAETYAKENNINFVELKECKHNYNETVTTEATCTEKGVKTCVCSECGNSYTEVIPATGHKEVVDKAVAATCIKAGLTEGKHCLECGEVIVAQKTIGTTGHKIIIVGAKKTTYVEDGYTGDKKCSVCGKVTQKGTKITKLKLKTPSFSVSAGKKLFKVKYTKVTGATGFQVKYTIGKKTVTKTFNASNSVTKTISGLKKGSYKVQIRAFVKQGSKTAYSSWTTAKTVKVK